MDKPATHYSVLFVPSGKRVSVEKNRTVLEAAEAVGVELNSLCGGDGICGKCKVLIKSGCVESEPSQFLKPEEIRAGYVLACKARVVGDLEVETQPTVESGDEQILVSDTVPPGAAMFTRGGDVVGIEMAPPLEPGEGGGEGRQASPRSGKVTATPPPSPLSAVPLAARLQKGPLTTKLFLKLPPPTLEDTLSDLDRIYREIARSGDVPIMQTGLANIKNLAGFLRGADWQVTATLGKRGGTVELVLLEKGDTSRSNYGLAVDIGTTTIVVQLVDLNSGKTVGTKASTNKQAKYGDDVISRIIFASERSGLDTLRGIVVDTVNRLVSYLVTESGVRLGDITAVVCAGNTTMLHLLLAIDPTFLRKEPYIAVANSVPVIRAAEAGIRINPRGLLLCLPGVSSYVGGDISAGVVASGMSRSPELCMLMDVGTNGEIVLGNQEWLVSCSASAGPCFEGSGISAGMRASTGAIQQVQIVGSVGGSVMGDFDPHPNPLPEGEGASFRVVFTTVHAGKPRGICGSGMIDVISEFLRVGVIDRAGRMDADFPSKRMRRQESGEPEFVLAWGPETEYGKDITVTQSDVANILRAKAALFAGARVLARKMGLTCEAVHKFYIAGGFGNYIDIEKAVRIGMIPDIDRAKIRFIGNSSLAGARLALVSSEALDEAYKVADRMTYIELSADNTFHEEFTAALFLPHTDSTLFPSVSKQA
ncbi:MAG: ASKHA domain-containing protein [Planctomycetota bacterium]|nr:ASKHA domain-containing protein [Planctomycetota bacterium]